MNRLFKIAYRAVVICGLAALIVGLLIRGADRARAQIATPGLLMVPLGYCQLTSIASATALSSCSGGIPAGATMIALGADTANVRYRDDGTAPTSSVGMVLVFGQNPILYSGTLSKLQFISATGVLNVSFYR